MENLSLPQKYNLAKERGFVHRQKKGWNWLKEKAEWLKFLETNTNIEKPKTKKEKLYTKAKTLGLEASYKSITVASLKKFIKKDKKSKNKRPKFDTEALTEFISSTLPGRLVIPSSTDITELLDTLTKIQYRREDFLYYITFNNNGQFFTLSANFLQGIIDKLGPKNFEFGSDPEAIIGNFQSAVIVKESKIVGLNMPTNGFLPYTFTNEMKSKFSYIFKENGMIYRDPIRRNHYDPLVVYWNRYVPHHSSGDDCVGNCIKIAEEESNNMPKGSYQKYTAFRANNGATYDIRQKDFEFIAKELNISIIVHRCNDENTDKALILRYNEGTHSNGELKIYSYRNHAFLYEPKTPFTKFSITHGYTSESKNVLEWIRSKPNLEHKRNIYSTRKKGEAFETDNSGGISSLNFIKFAIANKDMITDMDPTEILLSKPKNYTECAIDHDCDLSPNFKQLAAANSIRVADKKGNNPFCSKRCNCKKEKNNEEKIHKDKTCEYDDRIYADFETFTEEGTAIHIQDMLVTEYKQVIRSYLLSEGLPSTLFLEDINNGIYGRKDNHFVIFHNLGYDFNFIAQTKGIYIIDRMQTTASKTKCVITSYKNKKIYFKDSYSVITKPLSNFPKSFGFEEEKKGACPYGYYNSVTIKEEYAPISEAIKYVSNNSKEDFLDSTKDYLHPKNDRLFRHNQHRLDYCKQDVTILRKGYEVFRNMVKEVYKEELDWCVSIPQIAFNNVFNNGCLDGVVPMSGLQLLYLSNFIIGGKCMSSSNKRIMAKGIVPLDFNSLYPSAMAREDFIVPMGNGRQLNTSTECGKNFDLNKYAVAYLSINITKVKKARAFPLIKSPSGSFTNKPDPKEIIFVSKVSLQDMIKFQGVEYTVLGGIVWDSKDFQSNDGLSKEMVELYTERAKQKKLPGEGVQEIIKLVMNSTYGRFIMKPIDEKEVFFHQYKEGEKNHKKFKDYCSRHYNHIISIQELDNVAIIKRIKSIFDHSNYAHIGIAVLDMSKRLMNEMMCLAEDNNIEIFYQDTDSTHMYAKDVPRIAKLFVKEYGRDLLGKWLYQFSSDFDSIKGYKEPIATDAIYVGKKTYLEIIEYKPIDESETKESLVVAHIRMKGIPKRSILAHPDVNPNGDKSDAQIIKDLKALYIKLYNGKAVKFDMLADNAASFDFGGFQVKSNLDFIRFVHFRFHPSGTAFTEEENKEADRLAEDEKALRKKIAQRTKKCRENK